MSEKEKQIQEMTRVILAVNKKADGRLIAEALYEAGYRKMSDYLVVVGK